MSKQRTIKSVSFSWGDPYEMKMLQHTAHQNGNFSVYVKRLIQRDMEHGAPTPTFPAEQEQNHDEQEENAKSFL